MRKLNEEDRLLRRISHLRSLLLHTEELQIVSTLKEFIADTETQFVTLQPDHRPKATLH